MKKYSDPIHGFICLEEKVEQQLIKSKWIRRLQNIQQLGAVSFVFPSATHSRFAHSLGVMEYAGKFGDALRDEQHSAFSETGLTDKHRAARIVGLLHDIGHPPFSHNIENAFKSEYPGVDLEEYSDSEGEGQEIELYDNHPLFESVKDWDGWKKNFNPYSHEAIGRAILKRSELWEWLEDLQSPVTRLLQGTDNPFLFMIIDSALDADKMDYLQRDAKSLNLGYGFIDADQILEELTLDGSVLAVKESGINAFQHFLLARYHWYSGILFHEKVSVLEKLVEIAYGQLSQSKLGGENVLPNLKDYLDMVHDTLEQNRTKTLNFFRFDDTYVVTRFNEAYQNMGELECHEESLSKESLSSILRAIVEGIPYPCICQVDTVASAKESKPHHEAVKKFNEFWEVLSDDYSQEISDKRIIKISHKMHVLKDENQPTIISQSHGSGSIDTFPNTIFNGFSSEGGEIVFRGRRIHADPRKEDLVRDLKEKWSETIAD